MVYDHVPCFLCTATTEYICINIWIAWTRAYSHTCATIIDIDISIHRFIYPWPCIVSQLVDFILFILRLIRKSTASKFIRSVACIRSIASRVYIIYARLKRCTDSLSTEAAQWIHIFFDALDGVVVVVAIFASTNAQNALHMHAPFACAWPPARPDSPNRIDNTNGSDGSDSHSLCKW